jgi:predicted RNA-binding protein YlxR (DUF448 family)
MRSEKIDLLRLAVFKDLEVVLRKAANQPARGIVHDDVYVDEAGDDADGRVGSR